MVYPVVFLGGEGISVDHDEMDFADVEGVGHSALVIFEVVGGPGFRAVGPQRVEAAVMQPFEPARVGFGVRDLLSVVFHEHLVVARERDEPDIAPGSWDFLYSMVQALS